MLKQVTSLLLMWPFLSTWGPQLLKFLQEVMVDAEAMTVELQKQTSATAKTQSKAAQGHVAPLETEVTAANGITSL